MHIQEKRLIRSVSGWSDVHSIWILLLTLPTLALSTFWPLLAGGLLSFVRFFWLHRSFLVQYRPFAGFANWITAGRLFFILLAFSFHGSLSPWGMAVLLGISLVLDVFDGHVARKKGQSSVFGQFFDMEVDAFFVLLLSIYFFLHEPFGPWVLIPGFIRYGYGLMQILIPRAGFVESRKSYAVIIAGLLFILLNAALVLPHPWKAAALITSTVLVVLSFAYSTFEYLMADHAD